MLEHSLIESDEQLVAAIEKVIKMLQRRWYHAHCVPDFESIAWSAAFELYHKPKEQHTVALLFTIADRDVYREVNKLRNVYVVDIDADQQYTPDSDPDSTKNLFSSLTFNTLTKDEMYYINWMVEDGLNLTDIAELEGVSVVTVSRRWAKILKKIKKENMLEHDI